MSTTRGLHPSTACSASIAFATSARGFRTCGDYRLGVARIRCTNPACGHDYFRPFSCKGFYLCPSCSQKRTLLFAEHLANEVLLDLPDRQFVFTMPKALRPFFRHDRRLFAEVSRLIYTIISEFYAFAAGKSLLSGVIAAHQTFGDQLRCEPCSSGIPELQAECLWHSASSSLPGVGGDFDEERRFIHVPLSGLDQMTEVFRRRLIWLLVEKDLLAEEFARNLLSWKNSGFSIDNSVRLTDALEFLAELTQHIPPRRVQLIRRYGLYSSRTKGRWSQMPHVAALQFRGCETAGSSARPNCRDPGSG